jgi:Uma2 family endonuclease
MADNTKQGRWIVVLYGNLCALFRTRPDVFVAQNLLWYALEGHPEVRIAPDVLVVFGRPKGDRRSYKQWEEDNVPVTVVFEVLSPNNTDAEMADKRAFYEEHGAEEYYVYDPDSNTLEVYFRRGTALLRQRQPHGLTSPRLGIRSDLSGPEMVVLYPDGTPFLTFEQIRAAWEEAELRAKVAEQRASSAEQRASSAEQRASSAEQRVSTAEQRAGSAEQRAARLAELSRKLLLGQANAEEVQELQSLVEHPSSGSP